MKVETLNQTSRIFSDVLLENLTQRMILWAMINYITTMKFTELNLPKEILTSLKKLNFDEATPIQEQAIPLAIAGKDILGSAQTGTGKTAAFAIPMIARLMQKPESNAIVLTPTRELATQVMQTIQSLISTELHSQTILLIGGAPMAKQLQKLRNFPRIVVGTPGRINDHLKRKSLLLKKTDFLVLDETDRMLDMGFSIQIDEIVKHMPQERQTLLFSATLPKNIMKIADKYLIDPQRISIGETSRPVEKIKQDFVHLRNEEKYDHLVKQLDERQGSVIIFTATKIWADKIADKLSRDKHKADAIHGDLRHSKREQVIAAFRRNKFRILVATDVAARGLDIPHIEHVINYDLPQCAEDYVHRIGRTARNEAEGSALSYVSPTDKVKYALINQLLNPGAKMPEIKASNSNRRSRSNSGGGKFKSNFSKPKSENNRFADKPNRSQDFSKKIRSFSEQNVDGFNKKRPFSEQKDDGFKAKKKSFSEQNADGFKKKRPFSEQKDGGFQGKKKFGFGKKSSGKSEFSSENKKPAKFHDKKKFSGKSEARSESKSFFKKGWFAKLTGGKSKKAS